jgi:hypothetical protein
MRRQASPRLKIDKFITSLQIGTSDPTLGVSRAKRRQIHARPRARKLGKRQAEPVARSGEYALRLLDHTERGGLLLTGVELLLIDEADRMLDMGFIPEMQ